MTAAFAKGPARAPGSERGFILVAVLWILAALATFAGVYAVYVADTASAAAVREEALRADTLATAAVELAALRLVSVPKEKRPTRGEVRFRMGQADISAAFADEATRIDLNAASREVLAGLFAVLGATPKAAEGYADLVIAWRAPASAGQGRAAPADAGSEGAARGAPFVHVEEVWRVAGLPPALVAAALPHLTVYAGRSDVNVADADPVVRAALAKTHPGADEEPSEGVVAAAYGTTTVAGETARITVRITFDGGRRRGAEAVILLRDFGADPYRVLAWRDLDLPARPGSPAQTRTEARP